jgi:Protein of unknown function (DUF4013)
MAEELMLDYATPFGFLFKDKDWLKKFLIASLLTYTFIGAAPVFGWAIEIVQRVARSEEQVLPELNDWKLYWRLGGKFAFVNALWLLPLLFAVIVLYGVPALLIGRASDASVIWVFGGTLCCVAGFLFMYAIVYAYFIPAMMVSLADGDSAWQAANPFHLWRLARPRFMGYLLLFLIVGVGLVNVVLVLSAFTLFLLLPPMVVFVSLVTAHFAGQLGAREK